jgi:predicted 2-oxoglutarate/Fe(II)-dependent dioxygenase YbiX
MIEKKLTDYIIEFKQCIPEEKYNIFLKLLDKEIFKFKTAKLVLEVEDKKIRNTQWCHLSNVHEDRMTYVHWRNYFQRLFQQAITEYSYKVKKNISCAIHDIQILKYPVGGHYKPHVDHGPFTPRTLSMVYFINEDYKGGELCFTCEGEKYTINIEKNKIIVFPSTFLYEHTVNPVIEGKKFSVVSWAL